MIVGSSKSSENSFSALLVRDFPKDVDEEVFRKWITEFAGPIIKRFHIAASKKYYLIHAISVEKARAFLDEFNKAAMQTNLSCNFFNEFLESF